MKLAILPEFVGKWFTRQKTSLSEEQQCDLTNEDDEQVWCYCKQVQSYDRLQQ